MHSYGHSNDIKENMSSEYIPFLRDFITYLRRKKKWSKSAFLLAASAEKTVSDLRTDEISFLQIQSSSDLKTR